jgi:uncharacterized protein YeaO (DUF488 family)
MFMVLQTKSMGAEPSEQDGLRICVMRDPRIYNRYSAAFEKKFLFPMYHINLKSLSPPAWLKDGYIQEKISWEDYVPIFKREVLEKQSELIKAISYLAMRTDITLLCSEKTPEQCHRRLLAEECKKYQSKLELIIE